MVWFVSRRRRQDEKEGYGVGKQRLSFYLQGKMFPKCEIVKKKLKKADPINSLVRHEQTTIFSA